MVRKIRLLAPDKGGAIPAIALTAYASAEDRERALAAGFRTHVPKPIETAELVRAIARFVEREGAPRENGASAAKARRRRPQLTLADLTCAS